MQARLTYSIAYPRVDIFFIRKLGTVHPSYLSLTYPSTRESQSYHEPRIHGIEDEGKMRLCEEISIELRFLDEDTQGRINKSRV